MKRNALMLAQAARILKLPVVLTSITANDRTVRDSAVTAVCVTTNVARAVARNP